ncbi:unnamed protein product, partial [Polarella glacialis]
RCWPLRQLAELQLASRRSRGTVQAIRGLHTGDGWLAVAARLPPSGVSDGPLVEYTELLATLLHELAHFEEADHGPAFYLLLGQLVTECCGEDSLRADALRRRVELEELWPCRSRWLAGSQALWSSGGTAPLSALKLRAGDG